MAENRTSRDKQEIAWLKPATGARRDADELQK